MSEGRRTFVVGRSGSGKTTWTKAAIGREARVVVFDVKGEDYNGRGWRHVQPSRNEADLIAAVRKPAFRLAYQVTSAREMEQLDRVSKVVKAAALDGGPVLFVVEEMDVAFGKNWKHHFAGFADLCQRGRAWGVSIIGTAQRPADVHNRFAGNCNAVVVFQPGPAKADRATSADLLGGPSVRELVAMQPHEFWMLDETGLSQGRNKLSKR